ncbi:MAG: putative toxin-antitoxin system toxin component, PIN family [Candidatus Nealsonbacteria bacterium CG_4_9_14_0_8_um_filter_35_12]|uniref:Putative toxin-antitoxin system toxin component, PIN family n=1 Tax=Candidatus Nealsonbacteria bacterium CG_4_9_14_0_8_um_filter_35_12 TaxID=1974692 RepID=A0A2M8DNG3_9BACT|nr:MAG: putative toxin-antitoxin system toxin component, PIN family [Candidatus Nealsonbacteria bacterium CG_4_9_14_0_8_um_filter_35_12]
MIKVVLDTNVFISALFWKGAPYEILKKVLEGAILNSISPQILKEIKEKLLYKFKLPPEKVREFLEIIIFNSQIVYPKKKLNVVKKDPSDNKVIECVLEAGASFVISGDKHLLEIKEYKGIKIITPNKFLSQNLARS